MALDIVLWGLLVLALVGLAALVVRKLPVIKVIDPTAIAELKLQQVKRALVESRLRRRLQTWWRVARRMTRPLAERAATPFRRWGARLHAFEEKAEAELSRRRSRTFNIDELLRQSREAIAQSSWLEAEKFLLDVLRQDQHNLSAYQGLGETYLALRDFEQAKEVYRYLASRTDSVEASLGLARVAAGQGDLASAQAAYGRCLELADGVAPRLEFSRLLMELGEPKAALRQAAAARALEPSNPKILDFYIELSIVNERPLEAQSALATLREVNPDNQKIPEFARDIRELERKLKPRAAPNGSHRKASFGLRLNDK